MIDFTLSEIAAIADGHLIKKGEAPVQRISEVATDSRTFFNPKNSLFFALKGPRNNGHRYIPELIKKGVTAFVISEKNPVHENASFIFVENTTAALQKLAAHIRRLHHYPVVGITGSNGKTIVKEWLFELLTGDFNIVRSPKSFNSQVGVPLSVLLMNDKFNLGLFEAGISQPGEMKNLAKIIQPNIGLLTNIGDAHQENFQTRAQKTEEKLLLFKGADKLIFCQDDPALNEISTGFCRENGVKKIGWSLKNKDAGVFFEIASRSRFTKIKAHRNAESFAFQIPFTDSSSVENACHCFVVTSELSDNPAKILPRFEQLAPLAMRLEIKQGVNHCLLINDYYNSDITSLTIALSVLHQQAKKEHLKKQIILSDIQQTGYSKKELYQQVDSLLHQWEIDEVTGIGEEIAAQAGIFTTPGRFFLSVQEFENYINRRQFRNSVILIKGARSFAFERISALLQQKSHRTQLEINLNSLVHNLNIFKGLLKPSTKIMVMVKAFSYGSGDTEIARALQFQNVDYLAVAVADEGVELRNAGVDTPIVVMNPEAHSFQSIIDYRLEPNIYSVGLLKDFTEAAHHNALQDFPIHLKIDTGMNRLGLKTIEETKKVIGLIKSANALKVKSVFSHLAASDDPALDHFTIQQIKIFEQFATEVIKALPYPVDRHILNSAGIERFPEKQFEMVRLGIGLYGVSVTGLPLENISTLKSTVSQVKNVEAGETVGYSRKGKISRNSQIAIVPLGYADGLDRKLGNKTGSAIVSGKRVPIIGNICMDMLMLDVTGLNVSPGDPVEFFGNEITIEEVAAQAGTIPYEILTGISQRVKRVYLQE